MTLQESLYAAMPIWAQNLAVRRSGRRSAEWRFGGRFPEYFAEALDREHWDQERVERYRRDKLRAYLELARRRSPYYRRLFAERAVDPARDDPDAILASLPILTKETITEHRSELEDLTVPDRLLRTHTSGTTGRGLIFHASRESSRLMWATWCRYRLRFGIEIGTPCAVFLGSVLTPAKQRKPPYWRRNKNKLEDQWIYSNYHLGPETARAYVEHLRASRVTWLHGYPSALALLAALALEQGIDPGDNVRIVTFAAENVLASQLEAVHRAFGAEVRQHYGQAESVANFSECECGCLHVDEDFSTVEFIPLGEGTYRVIGTGVANAAFFFIRYDTGDVVHLAETGCECGRPGRIVESVDGRYEDYVVLPDGAKLGRLDHVFKDMVNIREAQLIQGDPSRLEVRIARLAGYGRQDERQLMHEFRARLGDQIEIDFRYVDSIPRTPSGKLRFVVSDVAGAGVEFMGSRRRRS